MDIIVDFRWLELPGVERHRVQAILVVPLGQDCPNREIRGVRRNDYRLCWVKISQYSSRGELFL